MRDETCYFLTTSSRRRKFTDAFLNSKIVNLDFDTEYRKKINNIFASIIVILVTEQRVINAFSTAEHHEIFILRNVHCPGTWHRRLSAVLSFLILWAGNYMDEFFIKWNLSNKATVTAGILLIAIGIEQVIF
jgi:hypothetical protein